MDREIRNKFQPEHFFGNYKKDLRMIYFGREKYHGLYRHTLKIPLFSYLIMKQMKSYWKIWYW